ncbi:MAG: hypothetical protein ABJF50_01270 [Paracoccaceae bacterium]|uniref:hypothetical protein n=1 Tax=Hyphomonas sp. TaxID=87 RepID=UPI0032783E6F
MASGKSSRSDSNGVSLASVRRNALRRLPVSNDLPMDLPIIQKEILMVLEALAPEIAVLFDEEE